MSIDWLDQLQGLDIRKPSGYSALQELKDLHKTGFTGYIQLNFYMGKLKSVNKHKTVSIA